MLALSRDLGMQYNTAFVLAHKMREAMGRLSPRGRDHQIGAASGRYDRA